MKSQENQVNDMTSDDWRRIKTIGLTLLISAVIFSMFAVHTANNKSQQIAHENVVLRDIVSAKDTTFIKDTVIFTPFLKPVTVTRYNAVPGQTDSSPLTTADNSKIDLDDLYHGKIRWIAVSRDLLAKNGGELNYGDTVYLCSSNELVTGEWVVHDCMNKRFKNRVDILTSIEDKRIHSIKNVILTKQRICQ